MKKIYEDYDFRVIEGVNGNELNGVGEIKPRRAPGCRMETNEFYSEFMTPSGLIHKTGLSSMTKLEAACCLSHLKMHDIIIKEDLKNVLILEDDAYPTAAFYDNYIPDLNFDFDIISFCGYYCNQGAYSFHRHCDSLTVAYFVKNKEASIKYKSFFKDGLYTADYPFQNYRQDFNFFKITKNLFFHEISGSYLSSFSEIA